jgi:hypothetical protein
MEAMVRVKKRMFMQLHRYHNHQLRILMIIQLPHCSLSFPKEPSQKQFLNVGLAGRMTGNVIKIFQFVISVYNTGMSLVCFTFLYAHTISTGSHKLLELRELKWMDVQAPSFGVINANFKSS